MENGSSGEFASASSATFTGNDEGNESDKAMRTLEDDLQRARAQLDQFVQNAPEIEAMHASLTKSLAKVEELENENKVLKSKLRQFQTLTTELRRQVASADVENNESRANCEQKSSEIEQITKEFNKQSEEARALALKISNFLAAVSSKVGVNVASLDQALGFIGAPITAAKSQEAAFDGKDLEKQVAKLKRQLQTAREERVQEVTKLTKKARRDSEASESEKKQMKKKVREMGRMLQETEKVVEELASQNKQLTEELEVVRASKEQMETQTNSLNGEYQKLRQNHAKLEASKQTGIKVFLAENEVLRNDMRNLQTKHLELCKQYRCLCHKAKDIAASREAIQKQYVTAKVCLEQAQRQLKDQQEEMAQMELENVTLASEIQALKDKLMLGDIKTESSLPQHKTKEHFDQTLEVIHNLVESQKQEIAALANERNVLVEKLDRLLQLLGCEEEVVEKQEQEIRTLRAKPSQKKEREASPAHSCIGYLKELLLPKLSDELRSCMEQALADPSVPCLTRLQKTFDLVADHMEPQREAQPNLVSQEGNVHAFLTQIFERFKELGLTSGDMKEELQRWLEILPKRETAVAATETDWQIGVEGEELRKLLVALIDINRRQHEAILSMKDKAESEMTVLSDLVKSFGCDTSEIKAKFTQIMIKLDKEKDKVRQLKELATRLSTKVDKYKQTINDLETEVEHEREESKQESARHRDEVSAMRVQISKLNEEHNKQLQLVRDLELAQKRKENDWLTERQELQDQLDAGRTELSKAKAQAEQDILGLKKSCDRKVSELQAKLSQAAKRESAYEKAQAAYADEINTARARLDDARKQKKAIVTEFKQRFEESQKAMTLLSNKLKEANQELASLNEEICKLKLENQSLAFQLTNATNDKNCFGSIIQKTLLEN